VPDFDIQHKSLVGGSTGFTVPEFIVIVILLAILASVAISLQTQKPQLFRQPSILNAADKELAKLDWQEMAYKAPDDMEIGSTATVEVALGGNKTFTELVLLLESVGKAEGQRVQVADRMEARLTGSGFEIIANTPEVQLVSTTQATRWSWQVRAKDLGIQKLYLSLNVLLAVNDKDTTKSVSTFQREILVQVTSMAGAWAFIERYWTYLTLALSAVVIPLIGYLWTRRMSTDEAKRSKVGNQPTTRGRQNSRR